MRRDARTRSASRQKKSLPIIDGDDSYVELVTFEVQDAEGQRRLLDALADEVND